MMQTKQRFSNWTVWADGSVINNGQLSESWSGFGYYIENNEGPYAVGGGFLKPPSTNNIAEMTAVLVPIAYIYKNYNPSTITFVSDSQYVVNGMNDWVHKWQRSNYNNGAIKNRELWEKCYYYLTKVKVQGRWVKGHAQGLHPKNELVDFIAGHCRKNKLIVQNPISSEVLEQYSAHNSTRCYDKRDSLIERLLTR